jgi:uncharacterized membrane-anchored protein YitT (DUF2179 family)
VFRKRLAHESLNAALIALGVVSAAMGLKGFLLSSSFIDGGVTGISMLLAKTSGVSLSMLLPVINLPFIFVAYRQLGRAYAVRSVLGIAGLAAALAFVPFPDVTPDRTLTAVFGGFFIGAGIGLAVRVGDVILGFNIVLFLAAMSALGVEPALYSILTYVAAAWTLDFVLHGIDEYTAITIVSAANARIRDRITVDLGRGVTVYKGYGGMSGAEQDILYCVVTRLEIGKVKAIVREVDEQAFFVFHPLAGAEGGTFRLKRFHAGHA